MGITVSEAIRAAAERLSATGDTARLDAELLMAHALGVSRSDVLLRWMDQAAPAEFYRLIGRRENAEPVAYICGRSEFYGREFFVNPSVLIPRPDSETLIDAALDAIEEIGDENKWGARRKEILDLGTGSGALLLTLLAEREDYRGHGLDRSAAAIGIATKNAARLGLQDRASFERYEWNDQINSWGYGWADSFDAYDIVIANPPYVEDDAELDPDVREYEPAEALFAGKDGLDDYRVIIPELGKLLNEGGIAILEIGYTQAQAVTKLAEEAGFAVEIRNDLANRPRCVVLR